MEFLGAPEDAEVERYVAGLEQERDALAARVSQWQEYAGRLESQFTALAGVVSDAELDRARKSIKAERICCFPDTPGAEDK